MRGGRYQASELPEAALDPALLAMLGDFSKIMR
jgi:hypothetical protein